MLAVATLAIAVVTPLEIRVIAAGLSPVVPPSLTMDALKSPWVLQPVFAGFSILSPSWLWLEMPVMLLVCLPLFLLVPVLREPNSPVATGLSFFPFATPMLMLARQAAPPGIALWQPLTGIAVVLATTVFCVWAAGRIFRVGLLMQGKGAHLGEMVRWVFKG